MAQDLVTVVISRAGVTYANRQLPVGTEITLTRDEATRTFLVHGLATTKQLMALHQRQDELRREFEAESRAAMASLDTAAPTDLPDNVKLPEGEVLPLTAAPAPSNDGGTTDASGGPLDETDAAGVPDAISAPIFGTDKSTDKGA